jgi:phage head maturation protease
MSMDVDVIATPTRFDIFTREWNDEKRQWVPSALKAAMGPDGKMRLHGVASSTIKDRHGDTILLSALEDMERAANAGLTIFGNHHYDVPEDVYGFVENAAIKQAGTVDADGNPIYDLRFAIVVNDDNERAVKSWKAMDKGSRLGISIGAMIPEGGATRDKKTGTYTSSHVELLETSIVGIPANPRSWVENAMKSLSLVRDAATVSIGSPQLTLDTESGTYRIEGNLNDINAGEVLSVGKTLDEEPELTVDIDPEIADAATCPDCGHGKADGGGCQNAFHSKDVEPEVQEAKVRVIEIDTGDDSGGSSQEAPPSEPAPVEETEEDDIEASEAVVADATDAVEAAETVIASLDPAITATFQHLLDLTTGLTRELAASIERERAATAAADAATRERDDVIRTSEELLRKTNGILIKLADLPVGRRTVFREATTEFEALEGIYSSDFLSLLRSKNT